MRLRGVADRAAFTGGDLFRDPFPRADVLVIGHVLADFSLNERISLVFKAFEAVNPGGALLVYDPMTDPDRPVLDASVAGLHMLLMTEGGQAYPVVECQQWLRDAGFADVTGTRIGRGNAVVIGRKE
jgi:hypothetical protein